MTETQKAIEAEAKQEAAEKYPYPLINQSSKDWATEELKRHSIDAIRHHYVSGFIAGRSKSLEAERKTAIGFAHWKDRHFKRTYPWTGYFYCLEHYESIKLIPGVKYGEHYSFEQLYDLYIASQK